MSEERRCGECRDRSLYVQRTAKRSGIARKLIRQAERLAVEAGASSLWLSAWSGNAEALAFYRALGSQSVGVIDYMIESHAYENQVPVKSSHLMICCWSELTGMKDVLGDRRPGEELEEL